MTPEEKLIVDRLKATYADVDEMRRVFDIVTKTLALREAEIERLKALLTRAADALKYMEVNWPNEKKGDYDPLIRQLRKAAE